LDLARFQIVFAKGCSLLPDQQTRKISGLIYFKVHSIFKLVLFYLWCRFAMSSLVVSDDDINSFKKKLILPGYPGSFVPILSSIDLQGSDECKVKTAVVAIHGLGEDVALPFLSIVAAVNEAHSTRFDLNTVAVIVPWFHAKQVSATEWGDEPPFSNTPRPLSKEVRSVYWSNSSWISAGNSESGIVSPKESSESAKAGFSSFEILDVLHAILSNAERFPLLEQITFVGFSAGGQMINRYAWATDVGSPGYKATDFLDSWKGMHAGLAEEDLLGFTAPTDLPLPPLQRPARDGDPSSATSTGTGRSESEVAVRFIVSDASSYLYFDARRPDTSTCSDGKDTGADHSCALFPTYKYDAISAAADSSSSSFGVQEADSSNAHVTAVTPCKDFDSWKYGIGFIPSAQDGYQYMDRFSRNSSLVSLKTTAFRAKDVRFLLGSADTCNCKVSGYLNPAHCFHARSLPTQENGASSGRITQLDDSAVLSPQCSASVYDVYTDSSVTTCCDTYPDARQNDLSVTCGASMQGSNRLQRGLNYMSYLTSFEWPTSAEVGSQVQVELQPKTVVATTGEQITNFPVFAVIENMEHDCAMFYRSSKMHVWAYAPPTHSPAGDHALHTHGPWTVLYVLSVLLLFGAAVVGVSWACKRLHLNGSESDTAAAPPSPLRGSRRIRMDIEANNSGGNGSTGAGKTVVAKSVEPTETTRLL
jgi:hypothetical protein